MERRFVKDYKYEDGKPVYTGELHYADITPRRRKQAIVTAAAVVIMYGAAAFCGNLMTRWWPAGAPFTGLVISIFLFCYESGRFYRLAVPMERRHYEGTFLHIGLYAVFNFVLSAASAVAGAVWLFQTENVNPPEYFTPLLCFGITVVSFKFFNGWRSLHKK